MPSHDGFFSFAYIHKSVILSQSLLRFRLKPSCFTDSGSVTVFLAVCASESEAVGASAVRASASLHSSFCVLFETCGFQPVGHVALMCSSQRKCCRVYFRHPSICIWNIFKYHQSVLCQAALLYGGVGLQSAGLYESVKQDALFCCCIFYRD